MTSLSIYHQTATRFRFSLGHRHAGHITSMPLAGAVGTNGQKGGWLVSVDEDADVPESIRGLHGARFVRMEQAEEAIIAALA